MLKLPIKNQTDKSDRFLKIRGVPMNLLGQPRFDLKKYTKKIQVERGSSVKQFSVSKQIDIFSRTLKNPFGNYIYCISSDYNALKAKQAALSIFYSFLEHYDVEHNPDFKLPYWHQVMGSFKDSLRDDNYAKEKIGSPGLLVIDNLAVNSTGIKLEKVRDLIETYACPKIVVTCGTCPLKFMQEVLYSQVNRVLYIGTSNTKEI